MLHLLTPRPFILTPHPLRLSLTPHIPARPPPPPPPPHEPLKRGYGPDTPPPSPCDICWPAKRCVSRLVSPMATGAYYVPPPAPPPPPPTRHNYNLVIYRCFAVISLPLAPSSSPLTPYAFPSPLISPPAPPPPHEPLKRGYGPDTPPPPPPPPHVTSAGPLSAACHG